MRNYTETPWNPNWMHQGAWFEPYATLAPDSPTWPTLAWLNQHAQARALHNANQHQIAFISQAAPLKALAYEQQIFTTGHIPSRTQSWHDWFNALSWLTFPRCKAALNTRHASAGDHLTHRGRERDALTLFDEAGAIVLYAHPPLAAALQSHRWSEVWAHPPHATASTLRYLLFGHGALEQGLQPFIGWTAKAWFIEIDVDLLHAPWAQLIPWLDAHLAEAITHRRHLNHPRDLSPLPLLGIPGWHPQQTAEFYANTDYFRPKRRS